jgi:ABC-type multidrug transport system fused ATPase/permease subunit
VIDDPLLDHAHFSIGYGCNTVTVIKSIKAALALLPKRDQRVLGLVVVIQFFIALLDLAGVFFLGVVAALAAASFSGSSIGGGVFGSFVGSLPTSAEFVLGLSLLAGAVLISKSILSLYLTRRTFRFLANRQAMVSGSIAQRLLSRPLLEVQARSSQEISVALTNGVAALTQNTLGAATVIAAELSLVVALLAGLLFVDPLVALFAVGFFGLLVMLLQLLLGPWATQLGHRLSESDIGSITVIQHALRAYREITVLGRRELSITRFQAWRWGAAKVQADQFILSQVGKYVFEIGLVVGGGLLVLAVSLTRDVVAGIGIITVFLAASGRLFPSLLRMQASLSNIRGSAGVGAITLSLVEDLTEAESHDSIGYISAPLAAKLDTSAHDDYAEFEPIVSLSEVSLGYPGTRNLVLESVTFEVEANHSLAIVGATGAGKSTLADVILGVLLPDTGSVLISGVGPHECVSRWPGAMAYVPQEVAVLSGTVRENVALGIPPEFIDNDLVWEALQRAQLSSFLQESREGLETVVGENGVQLSGGQRQRLGIARALYSRPKLLVLDEATSALDAETERIITKTLDSLVGDVTLIVIAHRLATVRQCDQVVHLSGGQITGRGTFEEVRAQVPEFNRQSELLGL